MKSVFLLGIIFVLISLFISCDPKISDVENYFDDNNPPTTINNRLLEEEYFLAAVDELEEYLIDADWEDITEGYFIQENMKAFREFNDNENYLVEHSIPDLQYFVPSKTKSELDSAMGSLPDIDYNCDIEVGFDDRNKLQNILQTIFDEEDVDKNAGDYVDELLSGRVILEGSCDGTDYISKWEFSKYCGGSKRGGKAYSDNFVCYCSDGDTRNAVCSGRTKTWEACVNGVWEHQSRTYSCSGCKSKHEECDTCYETCMECRTSCVYYNCNPYDCNCHMTC